MGYDFNSVLVNQYRGGRDSNGWHADNESELGEQPVIASVSLGAVRRFRLRNNKNKQQTYSIDLPHGSLLIMGAGVQEFWQHTLTKTAKAVEPRINLTFRKVVHS
ncbi:alpha-ketoglutarate-dependent dioxygenase AlkB [Parendozoicomonas sp. Alg238-R29]|uniref:alpha-ketoglutarate-dependent dioxygenase AlkB family protein n=1 Tax=Parendozoicomonas sp. Alg238-R29 TaxID=2993446 RepID=UPI00248D93D6|nr:alpha-ketoglutarate-dependent dioxygenase AlkB [Parendozoicomonas sp. Alg238-R29]